MTRTRLGVRSWTVALLCAAVLAACVHRGDRARPGAVTRAARGGEVMGEGRTARVALALSAPAPSIGGTGEWRVFAADGRELLARVPAGAERRIERRAMQLRAVGPGGATPWRSG